MRCSFHQENIPLGGPCSGLDADGMWLPRFSNHAQDVRSEIILNYPKSSLMNYFIITGIPRQALKNQGQARLQRVLLCHLSGREVFPTTLLQLLGHIAQPPTGTRTKWVNGGRHTNARVEIATSQSTVSRHLGRSLQTDVECSDCQVGSRLPVFEHLVV